MDEKPKSERTSGQPALIFNESQALPCWAAILVASAMTACFAVVATLALTGPRPVPGFVYLVLAIPILTTGFVANLFFMQTEMVADALVVRFGWWLTVYHRRIALSDIACADAVTYKPLAEYGGWGIRGYPGDQALNARGDQGVRLRFHNNARLLVGSALPDELVAALRQLGVEGGAPNSTDR